MTVPFEALLPEATAIFWARDRHGLVMVRWQCCGAEKKFALGSTTIKDPDVLE